MSLVVVSKFSLNKLQKYVVESFKDVENKNLPIRDFSKEIVFNKEHSFGKICKIIPSK